MILQRLQLSNFRQYENLDLRFEDGITGIVGKNGSGKSTILEALLWCLFGNRAARTGKVDIKRQSAGSKEPCRVVLNFILGDVSYCLTRSLAGKSNRSEVLLTQEGRLDAVTTKEVDEYIIRLIGLNLKGFLSSFFARQRELNALSDARPADRKDHLAKMLGVGRLDSAILLLKETIKTARQKIDILGSLLVNPEEVSRELQQKKTEISRSQDQIAFQNKELAKFRKSVQDMELRVEEFRNKELVQNRLEKEESGLVARKESIESNIKRQVAEMNELKSLSGQVGPLKKKAGDLKSFEREVSDLKEAGILANEKKRLDDELAALKTALADYLDKRPAQAKVIQRLEAELESRESVVKSIDANEAAVEKLIVEHREIASALKVVESKLSEMVNQKQEISRLGPEASCRLCLRPFADDLAEIEKHFDEEIGSLTMQTEPMRIRLTKVEDEGKAIREELKQNLIKKEQLNKLEKELAAARTVLIAADETIKDNRNRMDKIEKRLAEIGPVRFDAGELRRLEKELEKKRKDNEEYIRLIEKIARKPEIEGGITRGKESLKNIDSILERNRIQMKELNFDGQAYQQAQVEMTEFREKVSETLLEIERSEGGIRLIQSDAARLSEKLEEYEKSKKEIGELRKNLTYFEKLALLFTEFRVYLIGRIRPSLSSQTSQLFYQMTGGRYQEIELDEDYNLRLYDRGERFRIDRFSGGEIDLANLCFRLAISIEMTAMAGIEHGFIILDEIFGSQDSERQRLIFEGLGRLKNRFRQIIIISHIDDVKEMAEQIVSVEVDRSGISRAVLVKGG